MHVWSFAAAQRMPAGLTVARRHTDWPVGMTH
jgi:hypothetical protein